MRGTPYIFSNLGRGVNLEAAPYAISDGQARDARNFHTSPVGIITKRNGCPTFATPETAFTSLYALHVATPVLVGAGSTKLYKITSSGTVSSIKTGLTSNKRWEFVQAPTSGGQGPLWGMNGTDTPQQWDGVAASTSDWTAQSGGGSVPNGKYLLYHNNRLIVAGTSSNPSRVYLSSIIDPAGSNDGARNWDTGTNEGITIDIDPNDGQEITGIGKLGPYILVFKPRKTYLITDTDTGAYRIAHSEIGCTAHRSIVETEAGTIFLASDGAVYVTNGTTANKISLDVHSALMEIGGANIQYAAAVFKDEGYYLSIPQGNNRNELILEFDLATKTWWIHAIQTGSTTSTGINQFTILNPATTSTLYGSLDSSAIIAEMFRKNTYTDLDTYTYTAYWDGPWHVFGLPHVRKTLREIRVDGNGQFDVYTQTSFSDDQIEQETKFWEVANPSTEFGGTGDFGGTGVFGDTAQITERRYYTPGVGRAWSIRFKSANSQACQIYAYTTSIDLRRD
jgi:hypothetical protein